MNEIPYSHEIESASGALSSETAREEIVKAKKAAGRSAARKRGSARKGADGPAERVAVDSALSAGEGQAASVDGGEPPMSDDELVEALPGVSPADRRKVEKIVERYHAFGRKTTEAAYEIGAMLHEVKGYMPNDALWRKWVKRKCEMTPRSAENYISLPTKLSDYRERAIENRVPPAALYAMANAEAEVIEDLMGRYERGQRPTVSEVKAFVNGSASTSEEAAPDPADVGGLTGLKALGMAKVRTGAKVFADRISGILDAIEPALEPHWRGKRVGKSALAKAVQYEARRARSELQSVAVFVEPNEHGPQWLVHPVIFPSDSGWRNVADTLYRLGGVESWPAADKLGSWLVDDVIPTLEWAIGRKPKAGDAAETEAQTATKAG
ncbi:hypothetical protein [Oricola thermophila]|uniref:DUF3102 domain-containing protein n=1 Tax=Oricola thermophila TaxID=2742145 RepID=A0A6N1VI23_9HYPH|nr:hypothetical protein [Oricola thermophila]QKV18982.1 hypothetical protein HTY61_11225 [Oricola thermophila]